MLALPYILTLESHYTSVGLACGISPAIFCGMAKSNMKRQYTIELLPHLEYAGDWHDKPLKYIVRFEDSIFTQKFSTKKDSLTWGRIASKSADWKQASDSFTATWNKANLK